MTLGAPWEGRKATWGTGLGGPKALFRVIGVAVGKRQLVNRGVWGDWAGLVKGCWDLHTQGVSFEPRQE